MLPSLSVAVAVRFTMVSSTAEMSSPALTVGAMLGVGLGFGVGVDELPPPPHAVNRARELANIDSLNSFMLNTLSLSLYFMFLYIGSQRITLGKCGRNLPRQHVKCYRSLKHLPYLCRLEG